MAYIHNNGNTHNRRVSHELVAPTVTAEIFYVSQLETIYNLANLDHADQYTITEPGWYWWSCFPGSYDPSTDPCCLPDGDPSGPFASEADAIADAQDID